ncbi:MAG: hypothetical protein H6564_22995 [Lewinellaceae bacterium]|nr:hypothetical protein [Lewinellaceae bacterium]
MLKINQGSFSNSLFSMVSGFDSIIKNAKVQLRDQGRGQAHFINFQPPAQRQAICAGCQVFGN